jgi:UDP-N-acetylmuramoylalanine--D-glutamate ligase
MAKKIVILGGGESGAGAAVLARVKGFDVFLSDGGPLKPKYKQWLNDYGISFEENGHTESAVLSADEVIKSPGIPDKNEWVKALSGKGISVISEIEFAARYTDAKIIGITGTNGKTTTTLLTYHVLQKGGLNVGCAGNVGTSFAYSVATESFDYYVLELSSFQLDGIEQFRPDIAVLMNITPDHLDRYDYIYQHYINSKFRITRNQRESDHFIYCADSPDVAQGVASTSITAQKHPFSMMHRVEEGAFSENGKLVINIKNKEFDMNLQELSLQGKHNAYNAMAAAISARLVEIRRESLRESLSDFQNVEHRMEFVARVRGVDYINDSKATNVNSAFYALESMKCPVVWIAGGVDKGNEYEELLPVVEGKVKALICLGNDNAKLMAAFADAVPLILEVSSMPEAVQAAYRIANKGEAVLLSPACASFDLFENYEDRGHRFKQWVREL